MHMIQYMQHFHTIDIPSLGFFISNQTLHVNKKIDYNTVFAFLCEYPWIDGLVMHHEFKNDDLGIDLGTAVSSYTFRSSPRGQLKFLHVPEFWTKAIYQLMLDNKDSLEKYEGVSWECNWVFPALTHLTIHQMTGYSGTPLRMFEPKWFPKLLYLNLPTNWVSFAMLNTKTEEVYGKSFNVDIWQYVVQQQKKHAAICETESVLIPLLKKDATSLVVAWCARIPSSVWCLKPEDVSPNLYDIPSTYDPEDWKLILNSGFAKLLMEKRRERAVAKARLRSSSFLKRGRDDDKIKERQTKMIKVNEQMNLLIKEYLHSLYFDEFHQRVWSFKFVGLRMRINFGIALSKPLLVAVLFFYIV